MGDKIDITAEALSGYLSSFQSEMGKMQTLMGEIKTATSNIKNAWQGTASDALLGKVESFQQVFETVEEKNQNYVTFLNSVIESYTTADQMQTDSMESNAAHYGMNS